MDLYTVTRRIMFYGRDTDKVREHTLNGAYLTEREAREALNKRIEDYLDGHTGAEIYNPGCSILDRKHEITIAWKINKV